MLITGGDDLGVCAGEGEVLAADLNQPQQALIHPARHRGDITALFGPFPVEGGTVQPARITVFFRVLGIVVIVQGRDLIAQVNEPYAANGNDDPVNEQATANGHLEFFFVL